MNILSIIIPAFNEQENIKNITNTLREIMTENKIPYEIIFIDDGSSDFTWREISDISSQNSEVRGVRFSRNFGKEGAIMAGLSESLGDCVVVIDCDLQHPPEVIPEMYELWKEGYEVIDAKKAARGRESVFYKLFAKMFYSLMNSSSDISVERSSDFKLLDRKAVNALLELPERMVFFRALSSWIGFKTASVEFEVKPRKNGSTKWNIKKLIKYAVTNITSFTNIPMQFISFMGILFFIFAVILGVQTLVKFFSGRSLEGFSTVILLLLITGSVLMLGLGIIGYYISKIYEEIKFRPRYIIKEKTEEKE